jgi:DhnA family fructose-bisphosphate aldolase class Ia
MIEELFEDKLKELDETARKLRILLIETLLEAGSGHSGGPLGMADIFTAFYFHILHHDPEKPNWEDRDRLVLSNDPYSPQICTVDEAIAFGAVAVGYTIYIGSEFEQKMFAEFAQIEKDAHAKGIPTIVWMYPRGKATEGKDKAGLIEYGARVALELGSDMVKLHYPGTPEAMKRVVEVAGKTKVVVAGGEKATDEEFLALVKNVMDAGACGMAVGRNIWQNEHPKELAEKLKAAVFS